MYQEEKQVLQAWVGIALRYSWCGPRNRLWLVATDMDREKLCNCRNVFAFV